MGIFFGLVFFLYFFIGLCMNILILASEDGESISNSSPISPVKWTQKNSFVNYLIASLAFVFMSTCIVLNRISGRNMIDSIVADESLKSTFGDSSADKQDLDLSDFSATEDPKTEERSNENNNPSNNNKSKIDLKEKSEEEKNNDLEKSSFLDSFENGLFNGVDL